MARLPYFVISDNRRRTVRLSTVLYELQGREIRGCQQGEVDTWHVRVRPGTSGSLRSTVPGRGSSMLFRGCLPRLY